MDFDLAPEQEEFRRVVRDFATAELVAGAAERDRAGAFPRAEVAAMGKLGLFGLRIPEEHGGSGADLLTFCLAVEEIARVDASLAVTLSAGAGLGAGPIVAFGTREQQATWLPPMAAGDALGAFALTEPDSGSDAAALRTRARRSRDEWVIDGAKAFVTNSGTPITSVVTVAARTDEGISTFLVPSGQPGLVVEPAYRKMGWRASDTHPLRFESCRIPAANLLGVPGRGLHQLLHILDAGRVSIAALAIGLAQACLDASIAYAGQRHAFGGPIGRFQGVSFPIADVAVALDSARLLTYRAAWMHDQGRPITQEAARAKLHAAETAVRAAHLATQVFGGSGFIEETDVNRYYRDARVLEIGEGTSEVQRLVIARGLGLAS